MTDSFSVPSSLRRLHAARFPAALTLMLTSSVAFAYPGQQLLEWSATNLIAPMGIISIVVGGVAAIFRPELIRSAAFSAIICAVLFFIIRNASTIMTAMQ